MQIPAFDGIELMPARLPTAALRFLHLKRNVMFVEVNLQSRIGRVRHLAFAFGKPMPPRQLHAMQSMLFTRHENHIRWIRQLCFESLDIAVNLPIVQDMLVDL